LLTLRLRFTDAATSAARAVNPVLTCQKYRFLRDVRSFSMTSDRIMIKHLQWNSYGAIARPLLKRPMPPRYSNKPRFDAKAVAGAFFPKSVQ
jgi:hypothetical protein